MTIIIIIVIVIIMLIIIMLRGPAKRGMANYGTGIEGEPG